MIVQAAIDECCVASPSASELIPEVSGDGLSEHAICAPTVPDQNLVAIPISSPYN